MKPLDFVRTPGGGIAIVREVDERNHAAITYLQGCNPKHEHNAWWSEGEHGLTVIDSLPRVLSDIAAHPMGQQTKQGEKFFPTTREPQ